MKRLCGLMLFCVGFGMNLGVSAADDIFPCTHGGGADDRGV